MNSEGVVEVKNRLGRGRVEGGCRKGENIRIQDIRTVDICSQHSLICG